MIKIERNNLEEIANEYCNQMIRIVNTTRLKKVNNCHKYYLGLLPKFILCGLDKFDDMTKDFEAACQKEIAKTKKAKTDYDTYIQNYVGQTDDKNYKRKKKSLENKISESPYAVFCKDMKKLYT